ncbi:hypothetical protein [Vallitalea guaymasensis]|uniref:hypothetical protein n=1 Tax=Vallitalea guaymasensis TaxID=1185412 RepID=UPI000DE2BB4D|nr:hypothetical protein [Vallitalea guaymasensis]
MDKVLVSKINDLIDKKIKSKAISIYFFVVALADQDTKTGTVCIVNYNINRIVRLMKAHGIITTHRQVKKSLNELFEAGFISHPYIDFPETNKDILIINDFNIDKNNPFVYLSELMLDYNFYKLNVRSKRLFLDIYKTFLGTKHKLPNKKVYRNILKKEVYERLSLILKINRCAKIREAINALNKLLIIKLESKYNNIETYSFELSSEFIKKLLFISEEVKPLEINEDTKGKSKIITYSLLSNKEIESFSYKLKVNIKKCFDEFTYKPNDYEIKEIMKATYLMDINQLKKSISQYVKSNKRKKIKYIYRYFRRIALDTSFDILYC